MSLVDEASEKLRKAEDRVYVARKELQHSYTEEDDHIDRASWAKALAEATLAKTLVADAIKLMVEMKRDA